MLHYTVGVKLARRCRPADARRRAGRPSWHDAGVSRRARSTLTNTGASVAVPAGTPSAGRLGVPEQRHLPPVGGGLRHGYAPPQERVRTAKFGDAVSVPVYIEKGTGSGTVTLNAVSESDPKKTATAVCTLTDGTVGGTVSATLGLTLGAPASFGGFTPGMGKDYYATTRPPSSRRPVTRH